MESAQLAVRVCVYPIFFHFIGQTLPGKAKLSCGLGNAVSCLVQYLENNGPLISRNVFRKGERLVIKRLLLWPFRLAVPGLAGPALEIGNIQHIDGAAGTEAEGALQGVFQFPDIAPPVIAFEGHLYKLADPADILVHFLVEFLNEVVREDHDILLSVSKGGNIDAYHADAVKQILAHFSCFYNLHRFLVHGTDS